MQWCKYGSRLLVTKKKKSVAFSGGTLGAVRINMREDVDFLGRKRKKKESVGHRVWRACNQNKTLQTGTASLVPKKTKHKLELQRKARGVGFLVNAEGIKRRKVLSRSAWGKKKKVEQHSEVKPPDRERVAGRCRG